MRTAVNQSLIGFRNFSPGAATDRFVKQQTEAEAIFYAEASNLHQGRMVGSENNEGMVVHTSAKGSCLTSKQTTATVMH